MKLMVLDGNSLVNRAFYGVRPLNAPDGTPTGAVFGFLSIVQKLAEEETPDALCVAFDRREPTFRHKAYAGYKAQRKPMPEELALQLPLVKELLDLLNIPRCELAGYEADDLLGTLCRRGAEEGWDCALVTGDKDSFQLITDRVTVLHIKSRMGQTETVRYTRERFEEEYGFPPPRMVDLKALMGDASDNIPGVPGIGEKTALDLLHRYHSLREIYDGLDGLDIKPGVRKKLTEGRESAFFSFELATIDQNVPLEVEPDALRWKAGAYRPELYDFFLRLGFSRWIERLGLKPPAEDAGEGEAVFSGECTGETLETEAAVRAAAEAMKAAGTPVYADGSPDLLALHQMRGEESWGGILDRETYAGDWNAALALLLPPELPKGGHGVKPLVCTLLEQGVPAENWVCDTAVAAYLLEPTAGDYDLGALCRKYCGFSPWDGQAEDSEDQLSLLESPAGLPDRAAAYGAALSRAASAAALEEALLPRLRESGMEELYRTLELPLMPLLARMQVRGMAIDRGQLLAFGDELRGKLGGLEEQIFAQAGERFNLGSPKQLGGILYDKLGLRAGKKTRTGFSTSAETLEKLREAHPIVPLVLEWRKLSKLESTYVEGLDKVIAPDGRVHSTFHQTVTATGRLSSADPNLQNIPIRREEGSPLRRCFGTAPGWVLVDADYSQIELRVLAAVSGDAGMQHAFLSGEDIHAVTAAQVFHVPLGEVTHQMRSYAKAVNFGIVYGISAWSLADDIHVSTGEAQAFIDAYLEKYPGVKDYMDRVKESAARLGYAETLYGRRRPLPELKSASFQVRSFGQRAAMNTPIQGTAADIIKRAMLRVESRLRAEGMETRLVLQVHDELILEAPERERERACALLKEEMEGAAQLAVPLRADVSWGENWYDAKH